MNLLSDSREVAEAFIEACSWCERFAFCTPALDSELGKWGAFRTLVENASKLTVAVVGLDGMVTEPHALAELQAHDALRLVPAADGSFRAHAYRFEKGDRVRVMLGAGAFVRPGLMAPLGAVLWWEGAALDPFAAQVERLIEKARGLAHVPTPDELSEYSEAWFEAAPLREEIAMIGAPFIRGTARDAEVPELEAIVDEREIRHAMKAVQEQLKAVATERRRQTVGFPGGNVTKTIHWSAPLKLWAMFDTARNRYWNAFGIARPDRDKSLAITVEVNPPIEGLNRKVGGAFGRDPATGELYFLHRGRIGGGQKGIGQELFWNRFRGGVLLREPDRDEPSRVVVVGKIGAPTFPRDLASFVHEVSRIKASA